MSSGFTFVPLGVGDAFSALHYTCCVAVHYETTWVLIDCPHPLRKIMREGSLSAGVTLDSEDIEAVLLTHLHADHASGIEDYGYYAHFHLGKRAKIVCHPDVSARLWENKLSASMDSSGLPELGEEVTTKTLDDYFEIQAVTEEAPAQVGPMTIEVRKTIHPIPTTALKISAGGKTLGHSSDTFFDPHLIEWFQDADVIIHETNHGIHTRYEDLAALPDSVRNRMRLIHYPDDFDAKESVIEVLKQGELYQV